MPPRVQSRCQPHTTTTSPAGHGQCLCLLRCAGIGLSASLLLAAEAPIVPPDDTPNPSWDWSARLQVGGAWIRSDDRLQPDLGPARLDKLSASAPARSEVQAMLCGRVALHCGTDGPTVFAELPLEESGIAVGLDYPSTVGSLSLAGFVGFAEAVWEQPYLVDQHRQETDRQALGIDLGWQAINGGPLDLHWRLRQVTVDDDLIGQLQPALARDGQQQTLTLSGTWQMAGWRWQPRLEGCHSDLEGRAASAEGLTAGLRLTTAAGGLIWSFDAAYGFARHQARHPLFDDRRRDRQYQAVLSATWPTVADWPGVSLTVLVGHAGTASNLDFYDQDSLLAGLLIGYAVGP